VRRALLGVLVAATSCDDFTLVEPEPGLTEAAMSIFISVDRSTSSDYQLSAVFFRGADSQRRFGELADRALYVEGTAVQPTIRSTSELWEYDWEGTRADGGAHADSLRIRPPVLVGSPVPGHTVTIPIAGREGPEDVTWAAGEDLRLQVSSGIGPTPQLSGAPINWTLELGDSCDGSAPIRPVLVQGRGAFPSELRVPWEWLQGVTPAPAAACLRVFSDFRVSNAPYRMDVIVDLRLAWRIHVAGTT
jgi:hypothetical protein